MTAPFEKVCFRISSLDIYFARFYSGLNKHLERFIDILIPTRVSPNHVTVFRAILAVPINVLFFYECYGLTIALYVFACVLDYVDGALARARNQLTDLGKFLDPMMDKVFIVAVGGFLSYQFCWRDMEWWTLKVFVVFFVIMMLYESALAIQRIKDFRMVAHSHIKKELGANMWGKMKFCAEVLGVGFLLLTPQSIFFAIMSLVLFPVAIYLARKSLIMKKA